MKKERHEVIAAVYLLLVKEGEILLSLRHNTGFEDGKYSLIAGHVEEGESIKGAMIRETHEEIGIVIHLDDLVVRHVLFRNAEDGERVDFFVEVEKWDGEIINLEPEKCKKVVFFPLSELPGDLIPYVRQAIENSFKGTFFSEQGF